MKLRLLSNSFAVISLALLGCSSSSSPKTTPDASTPTDSGTSDAKPSSEASVDSGGTPTGDAGPVPVGTLLAGGDAIQLIGVTTDGYAVYFEGDATTQTTSIYAVSSSGGTPQLIVACISTGCTAAVIEQDVLVFPGASTNGVGALSAWTSTGGLKSLAATSYDGVLNASADGTKVLYTSNVPNTGLTGDLYVAGADGSGATALLHGISLQGACAPVAGFAGSTVVVSYCAAETADGGAGDAGATDAGAAPVATVASFSGASYTQATLATNVYDTWSADKAGTNVAVTTAAGELEVLPLPSGAAVNIDMVGPVAGGAGFGLVRTDGTGVLYATAGGALKSSPLPPSALVTIVGTGVGGISSVSPDSNWTLYYKSQDSKTGFEDLYLAPTTKPGTTTLSSTMTAVLFGADFTTDSSYVTYYSDATELPSVNGTSPGIVGTLQAVPVAGGTATMLGTNVWDNWSGTGTQVVFNDNFAAGMVASTGYADLKWVDVSKSASPTLIVAGADATPSNVVLTPAKDHVLYTFSQSAGADDAGGPDLNGLYAAPLP